MIKYIIWFFVAFGCGILFFCLGIYSNKRKTPMNFYSGKTIKESEIKDIKKYNKANSILWKAYSLPFFISGIIYIWNELIAIIILTITCTIGLIPLTIIYEKIYSKYKANYEKFMIIEYNNCLNKSFWLSKINESDWNAGKFLYELLSNNKLKEYTSENVKVFLLTNDNKLIGYCIFTDKDEIDLPYLKPWIGFLYIFPEYRGKRYSSLLIQHCENYARNIGYNKIYISTDHENLYEKYGFTLYKENIINIYGSYSKIYIKKL